MDKEILDIVVTNFFPEANSIDYRGRFDYDYQHAYLVKVMAKQARRPIKAVLFVNGMSGKYTEDEAIMELTDGLDSRGWFSADGSGELLADSSDPRSEFRLPARYGYDAYFTMALITR
jgi:hypothetical protein